MGTHKNKQKMNNMVPIICELLHLEIWVPTNYNNLNNKQNTEKQTFNHRTTEVVIMKKFKSYKEEKQFFIEMGKRGL